MAKGRRLQRWIIASLLTMLSVLILSSIFACWLLVTTDGAKVIVHVYRQTKTLPFDMHFGQWEGNIVQGLSLKDIEISAIPHIPPNSLLRIQTLYVEFKGLRFHEAHVRIQNARLLLPDSDPIVFQGEVDQGIIKANLYARTLDIGLLARLIPFWDNSKFLSGFVSHADMSLRGDLRTLHAVGKLIVDQIKYKTTTVSQGPGEFNLTLKPSLSQGTMAVEGEASMSEGLIQARRVTLDLTMSKVFFKGDITNPALDVHASSVVDEISIDLGFKGTLRNPELVVVSDPPLPSDVLLVMLATGRSWGKPTAAGKNSNISTELVSGFFDYLLLGGAGGHFARQYGLTDIKMQYDDQNKKIGLKKKLSEDLRVGLEIEQVPGGLRSDQTAYSKKLEGEMDVTEHLSVNVSQKVLPQNNPPNHASTSNDPVDKSKDETQIYLKYQNRF